MKLVLNLCFVLQVKGGYTGSEKSDRRPEDGKFFEAKIKRVS